MPLPALCPPVLSTSRCPGGAQLPRAMTAATCLVTASPTGLSAGRKRRRSQQLLLQMQWRGRDPLHLRRNVVISVPSPQEPVWGQPQSSLWRWWTGHRPAQGTENRLLVSLPELLRAQSILTQDSKAIWVNSWESHEQTGKGHIRKGQFSMLPLPTELGLTRTTSTEEQHLWPQHSDPNNTKKRFLGGSAQPRLSPK